MIKQAEFILSAVNKEQFPQDFKNEYLFLGRSNVGKSSLINFLTKRKNLARISKTPGRTITLNFYLINETFYLVDAPGYGYARRSKSAIASFGQMIETYLKSRSQLKKVCLLIDYKVGPTKDDLIMYDYLKHFDFEVVVVATKIDKLNQKATSAAKKRFKQHFQTNQVILTSVVKNIGLDLLFKIFDEVEK